MPNDLNDPDQATDQLLSVAEVAMELSCSAPTIRRWIAEGHLPAHKVGPGRPGLVRIERRAVEALLDAAPTPKR